MPGDVIEARPLSVEPIAPIFVDSMYKAAEDPSRCSNKIHISISLDFSCFNIELYHHEQDIDRVCCHYGMRCCSATAQVWCVVKTGSYLAVARRFQVVVFCAWLSL